MNEHDLRVIKSRANICRCFMELLREKSLQEINVKDICDRAMCSRNTFYSHFPYKESVLEYLNSQCAEAILSGLSDKVECIGDNSADVIWQYTENIIRKADETRELFLFLIQYDRSRLSMMLSDAIYDFFIRAASSYSEKEASVEYRFACKYIAAGLVSFLIYWMESPDIDQKKAQQMLYSVHTGPVEAAAECL